MNEEFEGCRIALVPSSDCSTLWPVVRPLLKSAVGQSNGRWTLQNVLETLVTGKQQLWVIYEADGNITSAYTTIVSEYPNGKFLGIQFMGGKNFLEWGEEGWEMLKKFALEHDCMGVEAIGRAGLRKHAKRAGFVQRYFVYEHLIERTLQ